MKVAFLVTIAIGATLILWPHPTDTVTTYRWGYAAGAFMGAALTLRCLLDVEAWRADKRRESLRRMGDRDA